MKTRPTICAYYFPNWHVDPRNELLHGKGWTEWRVAQYATPRFPGHDQPLVPLWGYEDEADPRAMAKKIRAASEHGVDAFIFDWYYFFDGSYRERCLQEGFFGTPNCEEVKFALMWANHDPIYAHPGNYRRPAEPLWSGEIDAETFRKCTDHCIEHYFRRPNYLRVNGGLYFSIFRCKAMTQQLGGSAATRALLDDFRYRVEKAGLGKLTLDARATELGSGDFEAANQLIREIGLDSASDYSWSYQAKDFPALDYAEWFERNRNEPKRISRGLAIPYSPVVLTGWDASPRTSQSDMFEDRGYPYGTVITGNTPELFERALRNAADLYSTGEITGSLLHIGCWNEWTEGAYLEPDTRYGYARLEAIRNVFGIKQKPAMKEEKEPCLV